HHAEDDPKSDAHQAVNRSDQHPSDERLEKISTKVPSDVISCAPGQPVGRNKGETVCKYSIDAPPLAPESVLDLSELLQQGRNSIRARLCGCDDDGGKSSSYPFPWQAGWT